MNKSFKPVILGNYFGALGIARSFYEQYKVKSQLFANVNSWVTDYTKVADILVRSDLKDDGLVQELIKYGKQNCDKTQLLLFACSEWNNRLILDNLSELKKYYTIPYIDLDTFNTISNKEKFYDICNKINLPYPKTIVITKNNYKNTEIPFDFPIVGKPSDPGKYHFCSFEGKKKAFVIHSKQEYETIVNNLFSSSYDDSFVVQEFISGPDSNMRSINCYCNKNHDVVFSAMAQPILEENNPESVGAVAASITRYEPKVLEYAKKFFKEVKYVGYGHLDLKYDDKGNFYFLECNPRLGRGNYFITSGGFNYTKCLVDEFVYNKTPQEEVIATNENLYTIVPFCVLYKYIKDENIKKELHKIRKDKNYNISCMNKYDSSIKYKYYYYASLANQVIKFKKYYDK